MNPTQGAIYARVSSDQQAEAHTIASQVAALRDRVAREGLALPEAMQFLDEGYSGATLVRPALERLRDVVAARAVERLYVHSPDRFARKYAYQVLLVDECRRAGVEVIFLNRAWGQRPEDDLLLQGQGMIAEYERATIIERHRRGKRHAARAGVVNVLSGAPYGYHYVAKYAGGGQARYEIVPDEARVVRQVCAWVGRDRQTMGEVWRRLTRAGEVTRTGKTVWDRSMVWGMLKNPAYIGTAAFGKTRQEPLRPRLRAQRGRVLQPRRAVSTVDVPPDDWFSIPVPALVDPAVCAAVQTQLQENRRHARQSQRGALYLLQGLVQCQHCGYAYYGKRLSPSARKGKPRAYAYYRCLGTDAYRFGGERLCQNTQVRTDLLDAAVWREVSTLLAHPERLAEAYRRRLQPEASTKRPALATVETHLGKLRQGLARLIDSYADGFIDKQEFEPRILRLRRRIAQAEEQRQQLAEEATLQTELQLIIGRLEDFAAKVHHGLAEADWGHKRDLIRALVKRVEVARDDVNIVFRIDPYPGDADSEKKSLPLCRGRGDSALWRPLVGVYQRSRLQYARVQPLANQSEYSSILAPLLDKRPQMAPVQVVETSTDIRIDYPGDVQRPTLLTQLVQRLMETVPLPEAMGERMAIMLEDRLQAPHDRPLDDLVLEAGFPSRPLLPPFLLDPHPFDWRRLIPVVAEPCLQIPQVLVQALGVLLRRDVVHAWGTALLGLVVGFQEEIPVDQVQHVVEHHLRIALGLLRNFLEFYGYGW
jgi:site-specific DNA recombinase